MASPYADVLNRAGIVPGMTREEILKRFNEAQVTPDEIPEHVVNQVLNAKDVVGTQMGAPRPEQQASFPGFEELKSTGNDVLSYLGKATGDGVFGSEKAPGGFPELLRRAGNFLIPQSLPTGKQVQQKAGETVSGIANAPAAIANLPSMASTEEGRRSLALGTVSGLDVGERSEQGDLLGLLADVAITKPGMGAIKGLPRKAMDTARGGVNAVARANMNRFIDPLADLPIGMGALHAVDRKALRALNAMDDAGKKITDVAQGARNLGSSAVGAVASTPSAMFDWINSTVGMPPQLKQSARNLVHDPKQAQIFIDAQALKEGSAGHPKIVAQNATDRAMALKAEMSDTFEKGLDSIDLTAEVPDIDKMIEKIRSGLEKKGVIINPITREITFDKDFMGIDGDRVHTDMQRRQVEVGEQGNLGEFDTAGIQGDIHAINAILGNLTTLKGKLNSTGQKPSLGHLRQILNNLGNLQSSKEMLGSKFRDAVLGDATGTIRNTIVDAAEVYKMPEAVNLRQVNARFQSDLDHLKDLTNVFKFKDTATAWDVAKRLTEIYKKGDAPAIFRDHQINLLERLDVNNEIIPAILGWTTLEKFPPKATSAILGGAQGAGVVAGLATGLGFSVAIPGAIVGFPIGLGSSPALIRKVTMGLEKSKHAGVIQKINQLRAMIPQELLRNGITIGAAMDRIQQRGEGLGNAEGVEGQGQPSSLELLNFGQQQGDVLTNYPTGQR
tara:strand:+ start:1127 stop:3310 length:2184 start_codon:yes stop_codon:yes gene_type:complete